MSNKIKLDKNNISQEEMGTLVMLTEDWGAGGVAAGGSMPEIILFSELTH